MKRLIVLGLALGMCNVAQAVFITFSTTNLGGDAWQYEYTVENDGTAVPLVEQFTIYFEQGLYSSLSLVTAPIGWDPITIDPDPLLSADGFYDALALDGGIGIGESAGSFVVSFVYLGIGTPGAQLFDIVDPVSFSALASGTTTASVAVPVPATAGLLLSGLGFLALVSGRRRRGRARNLRPI